MSDEQNHPANRRIDRIRDGAYVEGLDDLSLEALRERRDECLAEREYLSLLRRLVQGRAEILAAELDARGSDDTTPLVERLSSILAGDEPQASSRGEAVRVGVPDEELLPARRRVEHRARRRHQAGLGRQRPQHDQPGAGRRFHDQPVGRGDVFLLGQPAALIRRHQLELDQAAARGAVVDRVIGDAAPGVERHRGIGGADRHAELDRAFGQVVAADRRGEGRIHERHHLALRRGLRHRRNRIHRRNRSKPRIGVLRGGARQDQHRNQMHDAAEQRAGQEPQQPADHGVILMA